MRRYKSCNYTRDTSKKTCGLHKWYYMTMEILAKQERLGVIMAKKRNPIKKAARKARKAANEAVVDKAVDSVINKYISPEEIIAHVVKLPTVKVDRAEFLRKELIKYYP